MRQTAWLVVNAVKAKYPVCLFVRQFAGPQIHKMIHPYDFLQGYAWPYTSMILIAMTFSM